MKRGALNLLTILHDGQVLVAIEHGEFRLTLTPSEANHLGIGLIQTATEAINDEQGKAGADTGEIDQLRVSIQTVSKDVKGPQRIRVAKHSAN